MDKVYDILIQIIWQEPLPGRCRPHRLSGDNHVRRGGAVRPITLV